VPSNVKFTVAPDPISKAQAADAVAAALTSMFTPLSVMLAVTPDCTTIPLAVVLPVIVYVPPVVMVMVGLE
jgi:hypothetical protein